MAFTSAQLEALETSYAAGTLVVRHGDKSVTYASMDALWTAIVRLRAALRSSSNKHRAGVASYTKFA